MESNPNSTSRKKFLLWSAAILASAALIRFFKGPSKEKNKSTVTMLTQDGKLVEIDRDLVTGNGKKISYQELQNWIKK